MLLTELMQGSGFNESDVHAKRVGVLNYNFKYPRTTLQVHLSEQLIINP